MSKHTPGPWTIENKFIMANNGNKMVANLSGLTNAPANAALIAAAPVLLKILETLTNDVARKQMVKADWENIRRVIAKAKGERHE